MAHKTPEQVDRVVNDVLREELKDLEKALDKVNENLIEYMQLQKTIEFVKEQKPNGFKTKVDVGSNMFMQAKVENIEPIIINIGLNVYLELEIEEALKFLKMKINILEKEADVIRERSLKVKTHIKILMMYLAEQQHFVPPV